MERDTSKDQSGDQAAWRALVARLELPSAVDPANPPWPDRENLHPARRTGRSRPAEAGVGRRNAGEPQARHPAGQLSAVPRAWSRPAGDRRDHGRPGRDRPERSRPPPARPARARPARARPARARPARASAGPAPAPANSRPAGNSSHAAGQADSTQPGTTTSADWSGRISITWTMTIRKPMNVTSRRTFRRCRNSTPLPGGPGRRSSAARVTCSSPRRSAGRSPAGPSWRPSPRS